MPCQPLRSKSLAAEVREGMKDISGFDGTTEAVPFQVIINMDIEDWRVKIDELDRQLVELISERARCAVEIGKLKQNSSLPVYEPDRERIIFDNIARQNKGPLSQVQLRQIYERLVDVMRQIQKDEMAPEPVEKQRGEPTEMEPRD